MRSDCISMKVSCNVTLGFTALWMNLFLKYNFASTLVIWEITAHCVILNWSLQKKNTFNIERITSPWHQTQVFNFHLRANILALAISTITVLTGHFIHFWRKFLANNQFWITILLPSIVFLFLFFSSTNGCESSG